MKTFVEYVIEAAKDTDANSEIGYLSPEKAAEMQAMLKKDKLAKDAEKHLPQPTPELETPAELAARKRKAAKLGAQMRDVLKK